MRENDPGRHRSGDPDLPAEKGIMRIHFTKAHGAKNDFLLIWLQDTPEVDLPQIARFICDRHTGVGADGWLLVKGPSDAEGTRRG